MTLTSNSENTKLDKKVFMWKPAIDPILISLRSAVYPEKVFKNYKINLPEKNVTLLPGNSSKMLYPFVNKHFLNILWWISTLV